MNKILSEIILDSQSLSPTDSYRRHLKISLIPKKATIIIGVRRCGKSTLMEQICSNLLKQNISKDNFLKINFFDDRLAFLQQNGLSSIIETYYLLYPNKKATEKVYIFFDEIQIIPEWEMFIERVLRTENCEIFITGSSSKMLSTEISTVMRGRSLSWELFPFSFSEFAGYFGVEKKNNYTSKERLIIQNLFNDYFEKGGFPEVINLNKQLRVKVHQEYFNSILYHDLIERYDVSHPRALLDLSRRLINNTGSFYTLNTLTNYLISVGNKISKNTVSDYLNWLEDSFFLFSVKMYSASQNKSNANPKKIYCIDHSLVKSVSSVILLNSGYLLENLVYIELRRLGFEIYYYKSRQGYEVDFLVMDKYRNKILIQVTESLQNAETRLREIRALNEAMSELNINTSIIVTYNNKEEFQSEYGLITVIPAYEFLMEFESKE